MRQNEEVARPDRSQPRRGRRSGRRTWVTSDGAESTVEPPPAPAADDPSRYEPRRRYPWHDDPDYDPTEHRRVPPPSTWSPPPVAPDPHARVPWTEAGPPPVTGTEHAGPAPAAGPAEEEGTDEQDGAERPAAGRATRRMPRKLTVTRVAALRSREFAEGGVRMFRRAATADGADRSGLTALTYAVMLTYAVDAAVAVALANTLFFAAATAESKANVAAYLAITVAPFALIAPLIGPALDRLQRGRRAALATAFAGRGLLAVVAAFNYDNWVLYPAALGIMVLSKSFQVLKAAVTPRVLPRAITLVTTNSRLTTFGLASGGLFGGIAAGVAALFGSASALFYTAALAVVGTALCLRIPRWVESTAGEVPAALRSTKRGRRTPMGRAVVVALWGNGAARTLTGFLTLFVAFVVKSQAESDPARQLFLIGIVGAAGGLGSFTGNAVGARARFDQPSRVILSCIGAGVAAATVAAVFPGILTAAAAGLVGGTASALAKVCLDAVIQRDLPDESRASAFGRSETVLQLAWVFGGALGVLLPHSTFWIGFAVVAAVVALTGVQTGMVNRGHSLLPFLGHRAPAAPQAARTGGEA
jgi:MFS family permease